MWRAVATATCLWVATFSVFVQPAADPWQRAIGPWAWSFPRDHGAHPSFRTEWWYFTGNLADAAQRRFGYQLTIFRQGIQFTPAQTHSQWAVRDFYFGHLTISDVSSGRFHAEEKVSRGALGDAGVSTAKMDVTLGPWTIRQETGTENYQLVARSGDIALDLQEHPAKPLVLEGKGGLSQKAAGVGQASYYYSYPRLATNGTLQVGTAAYAVTGESWFDHEFSTSSLGENQIGWDWFCLQLDNHEEIMLYLMRDKSGVRDPVSGGTWIKADGTTETLAPGTFTLSATGSWRSAASGATYPAGWHLIVPGHAADLTIQPVMADQELRLSKMGTLAYWEGACDIAGQIHGGPAAGRGYTELTGYAGSLRGGLGAGP